jgi:peptidoglycan/LPS O-acetylase OafA/YrhL
MNARPVYRPDIDGLRAIAVLGVLLYHYGVSWLSGGFTGVDVFFVISGFLITGILRREMEAGEFSLIGFYDRRIRRIAPALFAVLIVTLAAGWFLLLPGDYEDMAESAAYSAAGLGNLYFFWNTGYFDQAADLQPLLHMWSLGVEEQFYVVWPLLLFVLMTLIASRRTLLGVLVAGLGAAFAFSVWQVGNDPKGAFYLPHPRAWELAIGAILVFLPAVGSRVLGEIMGAAGIALIAWSYLAVTSADPFPGINALYACLGAALVIWPKPRTAVAWALSLRPMVWIGLISYSLYLWHWPVLVFFRHYANGEVPDVTAAVPLAALSVLLGYLSWRFVERPFRRPLGTAVRTVGTGVASAAGIVALSLVVVLTNGFPSRLPPDQAGMAGLDVMWKWECPRGVTLTAKGEAFAQACNFGVPWQTATTKVLLWGESHAEHMAPIIEAAIAGKDISVALAYKCAAAVGDPYKFIITEIPTYSTDCSTFREKVLTFLDENKGVSYVILAGFWSSVIGHVFTDEVPSGNNATGMELVHQSLSKIITSASTPNREIVLVGDVPLFLGTRPELCNTQDTTPILRRPCEGQSKGASLETFTAQQGMIVDAFNSLRSSSTAALAVGPAMCASGECMTYLNGEFLYRDVHHLRRNLSPRTLKDLADLFGFTALFASR